MLSFISSSAALGLVLALQAQGHAIITPALGGGTARSDVKRPSAAAPCGAGVDIASLVSSSQAVPVTNGAIDATITNFNAGTDGSRQVTAQIDPTGTGKSFQAATVTTNGDKSPTDVGSQPLVVQVPAGLQATSGTMLVSFTTAGGFGNCIAATTGGAATGASNSTTASTGTGNTTTTGTGTGTGTTSTGTGNTTTTGTGTGTGATTTTGKKHKGAKGAKGAKAAKGAGAAGAAQGAGAAKGAGAATGAGAAQGAGAGAGAATGAGAAQGAGAATGAGAQAPAAANPAAAIKAKLQKVKAGQKNKLRDARLHVVY